MFYLVIFHKYLAIGSMVEKLRSPVLNQAIIVSNLMVYYQTQCHFRTEMRSILEWNINFHALLGAQKREIMPCIE